MSSPSPEPRRTRSSRLARRSADDEPYSGRIEADFGRGSPIFTQTTERLGLIFSQAAHVPPVAARFREWRRAWESHHSQDAPRAAANQDLFIHQTYVALLARFAARRFVAPHRPISDTEELKEIVNTDYFNRRGIGNFGEGDFFSWTNVEPRWESGLEEKFLETIQGLAEALAPYDFTLASPGVLDGLYRQTAPDSPSLPRWLAEYIVEEELGLAADPNQSLLDPVCGTGAFLSAAIGTISRTMQERGSDQLDVLFEVPERVRGMDSDPLAVSLARLNYLLALGDLVQQEHPPILLPVYLADATQVPASHPVLPDDMAVSVSTPAAEFQLPSPVIKDPMKLDWLLGRLTNYMDGAQLRLHVQSEEEAVQEVLNAYYNYLTATKARTPVPDALTPNQADILLETARSLIKLHIRGEGTLWLHVIQNIPAPAIFSRLGTDLLVGCGSATDFEVFSFLYLRSHGRVAMVMTNAEAESGSAGRRITYLDSVLPDSALLVTGPEQQARLELDSGPISGDSSWAEAIRRVRVVDDG